MDWSKLQSIHHKFIELYNSNPIAVRSPGRINLIGEHTDYNQGFVLPAAIDREITLCIGLNQSASCNLFSWDLQEHHSFKMDKLVPSQRNWANYIIGVVQQLQLHGHEVTGFDCVFGGDIPIGAGLSSSAALECGMAFGLSNLLGLNLSKIEIARLSQAAENDFVGMQCGLMDQYANMFGKEGKLIQLDCRTETHEEIAVDLKEYGLWLFNTNVKHQLDDSEYNVRRRECEAGVKLIRRKFHQVSSLRDCELSMLTNIEDTTLKNRCQFVIEENARVVEGSKDLQCGDLQGFGQKMYLSHHGLSKMYQVSCPELDLLVEYTRDEPSILGARMMGGGFGGCTINLIDQENVESINSKYSAAYFHATGKRMSIYPVNIANGTSLTALNLN
ncbi:MAG: galactokinase [Cyclobacteriaceae bacterium]|nr:MAG: galactokinase [Cyclobacteriaceae bacterium]